MNARTPILRLSSERFDDVVEALCEAFHDYPVMRYLLEDAGDDYPAQLVHLVEYFTDTRMSRGWPVLGIDIQGTLVAAANVTPPQHAPEPPSLVRRFDTLRKVLGQDAMARFDAFGRACDDLAPAEPHYYLGMIGVRPEHQGSGLARPLMDAVHELSRRDPESRGVALSTEARENVALYRHFGYHVIGERDVGRLHTWTLFRPDGA